MIQDSLSTAAQLASDATSQRWQPGLDAVAQSEIFASGREGSGAGAALALALDAWRHREREEGEEAEDRRAVVWVQTRAAVKRGGRPFRAGLPQEIRHRLIHVLAEKDEDALFALEEAVRCRDVAFVIGEIVGSPRALDFTASRRLTLAAERHGIPLTLVRLVRAAALGGTGCSLGPSEVESSGTGCSGVAGRTVPRAKASAGPVAIERGCEGVGGGARNLSPRTGRGYEG